MTEYKIYISYADANENWVIDFVKQLKNSLREQLGELDDNFIWAKYMLRGIDLIQTKNEHLNNSTCLVVILSPAYLKTVGVQEIESFKNPNNIIVVEHDKVERTGEIADIIGYCFWEQNERREIIVFDKKTQRFRQNVNQMARDIATLCSQQTQEASKPHSEKSNILTRYVRICGDVINSNISIGDNSTQNNTSKKR